MPVVSSRTELESLALGPKLRLVAKSNRTMNLRKYRMLLAELQIRTRQHKDWLKKLPIRNY